MQGVIRRRLVVRTVGVAGERGEVGCVHGQGTHVTEDNEQAQGEKERVSR